MMEGIYKANNHKEQMLKQRDTCGMEKNKAGCISRDSSEMLSAQTV